MSSVMNLAVVELKSIVVVDKSGGNVVVFDVVIRNISSVTEAL